MLVLSRRALEEVVFPSLGITIRVLRSTSNSVKLGVEAPKNLRVVRGEIADVSTVLESLGELRSEVQSHDVRNQLNRIMLQLELLRRLQGSELNDQQLAAVQGVVNSLDDLDQDWSRLATVTSDLPKSTELKVLLVDDVQNERELLATILKLHGFQVWTTADGVEALEKLGQMRELPDAVLMDLNMPRLGGERTLRCIRTDDRLKELKVFAVSGQEVDQAVFPESVPGFDGYFAKPIQLESLIQLIQEPARAWRNRPR